MAYVSLLVPAFYINEIDLNEIVIQTEFNYKLILNILDKFMQLTISKIKRRIRIKKN